MQMNIFSTILFIIVSVPFAFVFIKVFDAVCMRVFEKYKNEVFASVEIPTLTEKQKKIFRDNLDKANHNHDRWYEADLGCVDFLCDGKPLNLLDYNRLYAALSWFPSANENPDNKIIFDQVRGALIEVIGELNEKVRVLKQHDKLLSEQDIASKQLKLAILSVVAAFFSAIAAIASCYIAFRFR